MNFMMLFFAAAAMQLFNGDWEFRREGESAWNRVTLPHDAAHGLPYDEREDADQGYVPSPRTFYRKRFVMPKDGDGLSLRFDGVYMDSVVRVNGRTAGGRRNGYLPFEVPLDAGERVNLIEVECNAPSPNARWYTGVGILRDVWLVRRSGWCIDPEDISIVTESLDGGKAVMKVRAGNAKVLVPENGVFQVENPELWTPETPVLHELAVTVCNEKGEKDTAVIRYGIRKVEFTVDRGMLLNGKPYRIKGVCRHDTYGALGAAFNKAAARRELLMMKEMGVNAIRTAHNPHAPGICDLCDEMGFLVMDEAFDEWRMPKTGKGYSRFFEENWKRDLTDLVRRDRNHPCVILWSIGNEIPDLAQGAEGGEMVRKMVKVIRALDPSRPVTAALNRPEPAFTNGVMAALDVIGLNYNADWYAKVKGWKPVFGSETAPSLAERDTYLFDESEGRMVPVQAKGHNECAYSPKSFTWSAPAEVSLKVQRDSPWSAGEFVWCTFDYLGEPNHTGRKNHLYWPARSSYWGLCDLAGMPKDRYYLYRSRWCDRPTVHLIPDWTHPGCLGKVFPVWCYTNAREAELFLNGRSQGVRRFSETDDLHLSWDVAYEPGCLEVRARMDDDSVVSARKVTAGQAESLKKTLLHESDGLVFLRYDAVDPEGTHVVSCGKKVAVCVKGGKLLGVDNGSTVDHTSFTECTRRLYHGSLIVIARKETPSFDVSCSFVSE